MYPAGDRHDQASEVHMAELIREQLLRRTREELPHAVEVEVSRVEPREDGLVEVSADVWAETDSQKAILIGKGGRMVREVGTAARRELERELGREGLPRPQGPGPPALASRRRRCSTGSASTESRSLCEPTGRLASSVCEDAQRLEGRAGPKHPKLERTLEPSAAPNLFPARPRAGPRRTDRGARVGVAVRVDRRWQGRGPERLRRGLRRQARAEAGEDGAGDDPGDRRRQRQRRPDCSRSLPAYQGASGLGLRPPQPSFRGHVRVRGRRRRGGRRLLPRLQLRPRLRIRRPLRLQLGLRRPR